MEKKNMNTEAVKETVEAAKEVAKEATKAVKKTAKKTAAGAKKTTAAAKKAAKTTTDNVKNTASKSYTKLTLKETYVQAYGKEYKESEILEKVEQAYKEAGHRISSIKSLQLYIKPEDSAAYYVINSKFTGKVEL